jgi:dephospho-CoA kinase
VDSPLLIETGAHEMFPVVIVVMASIGARLARLRLRGMSEDDVRARISAQMPLEDKVAHADVLIDNEGTEADLARRIDQLWADLRERALSSPA